MNKSFFLGALTNARTGWDVYFSDPQAPSRYGAEAAAKYVAEKRQAQEEMAQRALLSAYLREVVVVSQGGDVEFRARCADDETLSASLGLVTFITNTPGAEVICGPDVKPRWFGFDIRELMQMAAYEVLRANASGARETTAVPSALWHLRFFSPAPYVDPYEALVPSGMRGHIDLFSLCEFLRVEVPPLLGESAEQKAKLARSLAAAAQLFTMD